MLLSKPEKFKKKPNVITLVSMARPTKIPDCNIYVDVSTFMEDIFDFNLNGMDRYIQGTLLAAHSDFILGFAATLISIKVESGVLVIVCCEAGERRSVATVELLHKHLFNAAPRLIVETIHYELMREQLKWLKF
jgi:hypothetical protein